MIRHRKNNRPCSQNGVACSTGRSGISARSLGASAEKRWAEARAKLMFSACLIQNGRGASFRLINCQGRKLYFSLVYGSFPIYPPDGDKSKLLSFILYL